jgi:PadR family transcriptional regulator, regulatory protein PadR
MRPLRISSQTLLLIECLLRHPAEWRYGYDLSRETGLKSGTLYPILMRLAGKSLLDTRWEEAAELGRPPRHMYRLTAAGQKWAREANSARQKRPVLKPAYGGRA